MQFKCSTVDEKDFTVGFLPNYTVYIIAI